MNIAKKKSDRTKKNVKKTVQATAAKTDKPLYKVKSAAELAKDKKDPAAVYQLPAPSRAIWRNPFIILSLALGTFLFSQIISVFIITFIDQYSHLNKNTMNALLGIISGIVFLLILNAFLKKSGQFNWRSVGFKSTPLKNFLWLIPAYFVYFALAVLAIIVIKQLVPGFDDSQAQDVGITNPAGIDLLLSAVALIIVVPLTEEVTLRGLVFGGLKKRYSFVVSALITSVLFALMHGQWNVGIDTFILSVVMCFLYFKTKSLWPSITLHAIKNAIAFTALFIIK